MQLLHATLLTATLAATPVVAGGKAYIYNMCKYDVNLWSVVAGHSSDMIPIKPGGNYSEPYQLPVIGGASLKLSRDDSCSNPITQFEYTITDKVYYDISNVDCPGYDCPFAHDGMYMHSKAGCPTRTCAPGEAPCKGAYTVYNDDINTVACDLGSDITLYLCHDPTKDASSKDVSSKEVSSKKTTTATPAKKEKAKTAKPAKSSKKTKGQKGPAVEYKPPKGKSPSKRDEAAEESKVLGRFDRRHSHAHAHAHQQS